MPLVTVGERDLGALPATVLPGLELRDLPWTSELLGHHAVGVRAAASYVAQNVRLSGPSGKDLGPTKLHTLAVGAFLSQEWVWTSHPSFSASFDVGVGHFDLIQAGAANVTQASGGVWLSLWRVGPSYRVGSFWLNAMYESRRALSRSWARAPESAALIGVAYGVR